MTADEPERRSCASFCYSCERHKPGQPDNCEIEQAILQLENDHRIALSVDGCPMYLQSTDHKAED